MTPHQRGAFAVGEELNLRHRFHVGSFILKGISPTRTKISSMNRFLSFLAIISAIPVFFPVSASEETPVYVLTSETMDQRPAGVSKGFSLSEIKFDESASIP